jgi:hypothetical protein
MENNNNHIVKYLMYVEEKLKNQLDNVDLKNNIRESLSTKLGTIKEIQERIDFQLKSQDEKQAIRIEWVASLRKRGIETEKQLQSIVLYDKIREVIPYLIVLNRNGRLQELIDLCNKELELIDFSNRSFGNNHISLKDILPLFESLFESEGNNSLHPEAIKKVEELSQEFKATLN